MSSGPDSRPYVMDSKRIAEDKARQAADAKARLTGPRYQLIGRPGPETVPGIVAEPVTDWYRRNPLVEEARIRNPSAVHKATLKGPAPTLFSGGDLPPFTASGMDPTALLRVPWPVRHRIAAAPQQQAYSLYQQWARPGQDWQFAGGVVAEAGNADYAARVDAWLQQVVPWQEARLAIWGY